jgi:hypothetical protein
LNGSLKRSIFLGQSETDAPLHSVVIPGPAPNQGPVSRKTRSLTALFGAAPKSGQIEIDVGDLLNRAVFVSFPRNDVAMFPDLQN